MAWTHAVTRAEEVAQFDCILDIWDGRAIRGVLAVVLAGLGTRQDRAVTDVEIGSVVWHLEQGPPMVYELGVETEGTHPEAASEWVWLTRHWPTEPPLDNDNRTVSPGPPPGYEVVLAVPGQDEAPQRVVMSMLEGQITMASHGPQGERRISFHNNRKRSIQAWECMG